MLRGRRAAARQAGSVADFHSFYSFPLPKGCSAGKGHAKALCRLLCCLLRCLPLWRHGVTLSSVHSKPLAAHFCDRLARCTLGSD